MMYWRPEFNANRDGGDDDQEGWTMPVDMAAGPYPRQINGNGVSNQTAAAPTGEVLQPVKSEIPVVDEQKLVEG